PDVYPLSLHDALRSPEVAGTVIDVGVVDNQRVNIGDVLFRIDAHRYEAALREAEAAVDRAGQSIGANTAGVAAAEAALTDARARDRKSTRLNSSHVK